MFNRTPVRLSFFIYLFFGLRHGIVASVVDVVGLAVTVTCDRGCRFSLLLLGVLGCRAVLIVFPALPLYCRVCVP